MTNGRLILRQALKKHNLCLVEPILKLSRRIPLDARVQKFDDKYVYRMSCFTARDFLNECSITANQ